MEQESKIWHLENFNLFKDSPKTIIQELRDKTIMCEMVKDEFIYFEEDPSDTIYFLKKGKVKIGNYSDEGKEIIKAILQPGEIFGELSLLHEQTRQDFAMVMEPSKLCKMKKSDFEDLMEKYGHLSLKISKIIGLRLRKIERRLESLVFKDARSRIVEFIKDQAESNGEKVGFETMIKNNLTHQDIANLTGTTRQTVTEVLNDLRRKNLINFDRKQILVRDLEKL